MEIIAVDDDPILLHTIQMVLEDHFGEVMTFSHPSLLENQPNMDAVKVVILDLNFTIGSSEGTEGLAWISRIRDNWNHVSVIVLTAHGLIDIAVKSLKFGAADFVEKPFANEKLIATVKAAYNLAESKQQLRDTISQKKMLVTRLNQGSPHIAGTSKLMQEIYGTVFKVAQTNASILITGEHGTGKEVIARFIHQESTRVTAPFVHIDLSAITESLFESTLFGHIKGSFTDATEDQPGLLEMANFGTLFLDGIGDIPMHQQSKLLSVLQNNEVTRIGENIPRALDIRLISTTHLPVEQLTNKDTFRQDLFFRINTVIIELPPLRQRVEDIKPLTTHFLEYFNRKYNKTLVLTKAQIKDLEAYTWPGNVRELKNALERMVIMENTGEATSNIKDFSKRAKSENLYELEKEKIVEIIARHSGNISRAAHELGIGRNTLYRKMKKYDL